MISRNTLLVLCFIALLNVAQASLHKIKPHGEVEQPPASAQQMKALLEERSRRRAQEEDVDPDKGDKLISRNGAKKMEGNKIELSFMVVSPPLVLFEDDSLMKWCITEPFSAVTFVASHDHTSLLLAL